MKTIDLSTEKPSLDQLMLMAEQDPVLLRTHEGHEFLLSPADTFVNEVELLRRNHEFLAFLDERFRSTKTKSIEEIEAKLIKEERKS